MDRLHKILDIIRQIADSAAAAGVPIAGLASTFIGIAEEIADKEAALTGKTRAQIFAQNKVDFAKLLSDLDEDAAKGE